MIQNRIDEIRAKKRMSYQKIGEAAGISAAYVCQISKGKRSNPTLEVMQQIAAALGVKVETVFRVNKPADEAKDPAKGA